MGLRFQKRIRLNKNTSLNISKSSASVSVKIFGVTLNIAPKGVYLTFGAKGTGASYRMKII